MSEIDPLVFEFQARINGYLADVSRATRTVDQQLGLQEKRVQSLEREMRKSSDAMKSHIKGLAAGLAGAFTGKELVGLLDSFTRLQNNLRVAGVAGEDMKAVQDRLLESALRYGVELEGLSSLYSSLTQASKELGATQTQVFTIADAVSASLKITGSSAAEAGGALQQLQQVFRGSKVQAEEYNSLVDGLYPLLEAAAAGSDRWGGSVGKLTADVKASKVTSQEFFQAILAGSEVLQDKAAKGALTLSAGITNLASAMTVYFGEADKANGVSAALGATFDALANNLDTIIPALATVATFLGVKYVAGMVAAAAATVGKTVADVRGAQVAAAYAAAQAEVAGILGLETAAAVRATAAVTGLSVAQGVAARAGTGLLAVVGGPLGAATLALGAAIYLVAQRAEALDTATGAYAQVQNEANAATDKAGKLAEKLATAHGKAREEALALARAEQENIRKKLESARASLTLAKAELARAKAFQIGQNNAARYSTGGAAGLGGSAFIRGTGDAKVSQANANVKASEAAIAGFEKSLSDIASAINAGTAAPVSAAASANGKKGSGPSAAELAQRAAQNEAQYQDELGRLRVDQLRAEADYTEAARQKYDALVAALDEELAAYTRQVTLDGNLDATKRARLIAEKTAVIDAEKRNAAQDRERALAEQTANLNIAELRAQADILAAKADLATGSKDRLSFELEMLDLQDRIRKAELDRVLATEATSSAAWQNAKIERDTIDATAADRRERVRRDNAGPLEAYRQRLKDTQDNIGDEAEALVVSEIEHVRSSMRDGISKLIGTDDPLLTGLIDLLIQNLIIRPLTEALAGADGTGGGGLGAALTSIGTAIIGGRASGGFVNGGSLYRVNEGASPGRVEGFIPQGSGHIVPLGRMNALKSGGGQKIFQITVDARNSVTPDGFAQDLSSRILRQAAEMDGKTAQATLKAMPGRMNQYQRDGF